MREAVARDPASQINHDPQADLASYVKFALSKMTNSRNAAFAEESAEVEVMFAEAAKFDNISKRIKASLARLEGGAQVVKDSIGPVYSNTQSLQTMNDSMLKKLHLPTC